MEELYFNHVPSVSESQLDGLIPMFRAIKVLKVDKCSFETAHKLMELLAKHHLKIVEIIHFGKDQNLCGDSGHRIYDPIVLSRFHSLRHLTVGLADVYHCGKVSHYSGRRDDTLYKALSHVFLPSLEYLKINMTWNNGHIGEENTRKGPADGELDALDDAISALLRTNGTSRTHSLRHLNLAWSVVGYGWPELVPSGGRYVNRYFPNVGGHWMATGSRRTRRLYPLFNQAISAGHSLGVVVQTFHHGKNTCERCAALPSVDHATLDEREIEKICGNRDCKP